MSLKLRLQIVNHIFLFLIKMDCNTQDIEVHFTFTKEQFEALHQELMAWNTFLCVTRVTLPLF